MANVATDDNGEVTTDRARRRVSRIGGTEESAAALDNTVTLPDHGNDRARREELDESGEEGLERTSEDDIMQRCIRKASSDLRLQVLIVLSGKVGSGSDHLDGHEFVSLGLKAADNLANNSTLDAVGLDGNEGALVLGAGNSLKRDGIRSLDLVLERHSDRSHAGNRSKLHPRVLDDTGGGNSGDLTGAGLGQKVSRENADMITPSPSPTTPLSKIQIEQIMIFIS